MRDYIALTKPRITWLILMSTGVGYFFGLKRPWTGAADWFLLLHTLIGTGLIASGTAALNQWYEREADCLMRRTSARPLPSGRMTAPSAMWFGIALAVAGFVEMARWVNLLSAVLGALTVTSEYSTGMVRTSLTAMPRRGVVFAAKALVFGLVAFVTSLVTCFGSFFLGQALMSSAHINTSLGQPHVLRAVIGGALFLTACGMLAFGLGMILRHTAGAITAAVGLLFVVAILVNFMPQSWQNDVNKWIPLDAGEQVWRASAASPAEHMFSAWTGFAVLAGYAVIAMIAGLILFRRRDA